MTFKTRIATSTMLTLISLSSVGFTSTASARTRPLYGQIRSHQTITLYPQLPTSRRQLRRGHHTHLTSTVTFKLEHPVVGFGGTYFHIVSGHTTGWVRRQVVRPVVTARIQSKLFITRQRAIHGSIVPPVGSLLWTNISAKNLRLSTSKRLTATQLRRLRLRITSHIWTNHGQYYQLSGRDGFRAWTPITPAGSLTTPAGSNPTTLTPHATTGISAGQHVPTNAHLTTPVALRHTISAPGVKVVTPHTQSTKTAAPSRTSQSQTSIAAPHLKHTAAQPNSQQMSSTATQGIRVTTAPTKHATTAIVHTNHPVATPTGATQTSSAPATGPQTVRVPAVSQASSALQSTAAVPIVTSISQKKVVKASSADKPAQLPNREHGASDKISVVHPVQQASSSPVKHAVASQAEPITSGRPTTSQVALTKTGHATASPSTTSAANATSQATLTSQSGTASQTQPATSQSTAKSAMSATTSQAASSISSQSQQTSQSSSAALKPSTPASVATPVIAPKYTAQQTLQTINQLMTANHFMGTLLLTNNGPAGVHILPFGSANLQQHIANTADEAYPLASLEKSVTGAMIQQLIDAGKLTMDTTLAKFYPQVPYAQSITIRQLLDHTSGIEMGEPVPSQALTNDQQAIAFTLSHLTSTNQHHWSYSNANFTLLAGIIDQLTGKSYRDNLQTSIVAPLGLQHTFIYDQVPANAVHPQPYTYSNGVTIARTISTNLLSSELGCGNLYASVGDFYTFINSLVNGHVVTPAGFQELADHLQPVYSGGIYYRPDGTLRIGGADNSLYSLYIGTTDGKVAMVLFANQAKWSTMNTIGLQIEQQLAQTATL
ncbi:MULTISPECIES: serine hydrolase [Lactiplantibacillus]|uniref:serine hydrolase n=1 Tax=Lactiplantibacillus TaxID=2767842 RepID=UPI001C1EA46F|nr:MULTISPECIES: serine hydrolase [Lactiplantibacillus]MBU7460218.1 serine hydrolase [Lactiplantibacillus pentosus]MBU7477418.1 serine hydrolase [Lactiplantibacillus pentosus]MBU7482918.1 serine hydrolase [Lactiplantibacillus sp. 30.2.29]MBU7488096.1 serine hydrolase [Lactiplantibacillus pentosus]MBU7501188.1 serine hydrolase [Lactiplantibacillus pentosus]